MIKTLSTLFCSFLLPTIFASVGLAQERLDSPRLVLILSVDQLRGDYPDRFAPAFAAGGFRRLLAEGVIFENAHQDHANTSTGPGHASISTGAYPSRSGIVNNQWYEENGSKAVYCVRDETSAVLRSGDVADSAVRSGTGRSPRNLLVTALADWVKEASSRSKAFSVSRKDRASILMGGLNGDAAYWYDDVSGQFVSSSYYMDRLPKWVVRFNNRRIPATYFGKLWTPLPRAPASAGSVKPTPTDFGWFQLGFPHAMGRVATSPDASFFTAFGRTPMMDAYMVNFAKELIVAERLGTDDHVDFLSLSFSVLDSVGHEYGPHSPEVFDTMRRLDAQLAELFSFIDGKVGLSRTLIALSSDHGVADLPEYSSKMGKNGHRLDAEDIACLQQKSQEFAGIYGEEEEWFINGYHLNYFAISEHNLLRKEVEADAARLFAECSYVRKVWTRTELLEPEKDNEDPFLALFRRSFHPDRSPDLSFQMEKYHVGSSGAGTSHGSPYRYDTHVPVIFWLPGVAPARISQRVATVDIAPTVASLLGISTPPDLDGRDLSAFFEPVK